MMPIVPQRGNKVFSGPQEQTMLADLYDGRRLQVLRIIVPGLLLFILFNAPFTLLSVSVASITQLLFIFACFGLALWATLTKRSTLASLLLLIATLLDSMLVILFSGIIHGPLALGTLPEFLLFLIPIALAGVLTGPVMVLIIGGISFMFTVGVLLLAPLDQGLRYTLGNPGNAALVSIPLFAELGITFLMFAGTYGFRHMQSELANLRVAYAREKELERLQELFISKVNHELRTPIMALQGYITLADVLRQRGDMHGVEEMLRDGKSVAENLALIVKSILNVRRVKSSDETITLRSLPLRPLLRRVIDLQHLHSLQNRRDIRLENIDTIAVLGDEERLQEVFGNLLSNAAKYSPDTTPIQISVSVLPHETDWRNHEKVPAMADIAVRDYGLGIPAEQAPLIFSPFVRLERDIDSSTPGTGLGLAICAAHIEAMHGRIWVESSGIAGQGSTFHVALPLAQAPVVASTAR